MPRYSKIKIPFEGPIDAEIAIVGDAPDRVSELRKRPFVGPTGQLQDQCMSMAVMRRTQCRMMNVVQYRPDKDQFGHFWKDCKTPAQIKAGKGKVPSEILEESIINIHNELMSMPKLKVVVAYGRQAMYILTCGLDNIIARRGSVYKYKDKSNFICDDANREIYLIPTFHPSDVLRSYKLLPLIVHDLKLAKEVCKNGYHLQTRNLFPYPDDIYISEFLHDCVYSIQKVPVAVDIEIHNNMISRISLAISRTEAISIPFINIDTNEIIPNREWIWEKLRYVFKFLPAIGQNFTFDQLHLLRKQNIRFGNVVHDTMIFQTNIINDLPGVVKPNSLAFMTSIYTDYPYYKADDEGVKISKKSGGSADKEYGDYSCLDACITKEVAVEQNKILANDPLIKKTCEFEMRLINGPLMYMMEHGVRMDVEKKDYLLRLYEKRLEWLECKVSHEVGEWINMRSPKQVADLIYKKMKLTGTGNKKTTEDELKILCAKYPDITALHYILDYRELEQIRKNTLIAKVYPDERIRCKYLPVTIGGRLSSTKDHFGMGTNLQNQSRLKEVRNLFLPDPGMLFCECDLKGAELWPVAFTAEEPEMMKRLLNGDDLHRYNASIVFNKPEDQVSTKGSTSERTTGKTCNHTYNYGGGTNALIKQMRKDHQINLDRRTAELYLSRCHKGFPRIENVWHKDVQRQLIENNRTIITWMGRKIQFLDRLWSKGRFNDKLLRSAISLNPRSTIADLLNTIMIKWFENYNENPKYGNPQLLMQNHDAFSIQFPKGKMEENLQALRDSFNHPININGYKITVPVEIVVSDKWKGETIHEETTRYE